MMSQDKVEEQLKRINFSTTGWGRSEVNELPHILMEDEEIEECVNGYYEAGFALLVATKDRLLLVDKKPLNYLTVEDIRFDMISEFDYHHRILGAQIRITAGYKTLLFTSLNQPRLRRLLNYVQSRMTQSKKEQNEHQTTQRQHLEEMNEQLREYLIAAHKQEFMSKAEEISKHKNVFKRTAKSERNLPRPTSAEAVVGWSLPTPVETPVAPAQTVTTTPPSPVTNPQHISSQRDFEQAAAEAIGATSSTRTRPQERQVRTPIAQYIQTGSAHPSPVTQTDQSNDLAIQQIVMAAARRVIPVIASSKLTMFSRRQKPQGEKTSTNYTTRPYPRF